MIVRIANALLVAILVFLLSWYVLGALGVPTDPWAILLAVLSGVVVFFSGRLGD